MAHSLLSLQQGSSSPPCSALNLTLCWPRLIALWQRLLLGVGRAKQETFSQGRSWILAALHAVGLGWVGWGGGGDGGEGACGRGLIAEAATSVFIAGSTGRDH